MSKKITTQDIVLVGLMAAIVFVSTMFFKFTIPTPAGPTMIKTGGIFCLLAGLLFGGLRGGLAAGIGSALFDLLDPLFIQDAPMTLLRFFLMGLICGLIAHHGKHSGESNRRNLVAAITAASFSLVFYYVKTIVELMLAGSIFTAAVGTASTKIIVSLLNSIVSVTVAVIIAPLCRKALITSGIGKFLFVSKSNRTA